MASASIASISSALKRFYIGQIVEQINQECLLLDNFEEETVVWAGSKAIVPLHTARNESVGAAAEGATLPAPGQQTYEDIQITSSYVYGQFSFTGPARAAAAKSSGAFENMMGLQMKPLVDDVKHYSDICMFTGGPVIGYVWQSQAAGTTWQSSVRTAYPSADPTKNPVGQLVQFYRCDTFQPIGSPATLSAISPSGTRLTTGAIDTSTITAGVLMVVVSAAPGLLNEPIGLAGNMFAPNWFNLTRGIAATANLAGNFVLAGGTTAVEDDLTTNTVQNLSNEIQYKSGRMADKIWLSPLQITSYSSLLQGTASGVATAARLDVKTGPAKGDIGFTGFDWAGVKFHQAQDCPLGVIYMLQTKHWKLALLKAGEFDESTGSILRAVPQTDTYAGLYSWYYQTYTNRPNASGVIAGVTIPV